MPRKYRLTGEEIRNLTGKRLHGRLFSLMVGRIPETYAKFACVVSKKVARNATDRNTIKRRCRAVITKHIDANTPPYALILYAKKDAKTATFAEIRDDIEHLLQKIA